jgi:hypothetical protein
MRFRQECKKVMDYWAEYLGVTKPQATHSSEQLPVKIFRPYSITTKTVSHYSSPKRRDPSRRWK